MEDAACFREELGESDGSFRGEVGPVQEDALEARVEGDGTTESSDLHQAISILRWRRIRTGLTPSRAGPQHGLKDMSSVSNVALYFCRSLHEPS